MYVLIREHDKKTLSGTVIKYIEWDENGQAIQAHDEPGIGRSLILNPQYMTYTWMTTEIVEFNVNENIVNFKTKNSNYTLQLHD